MVQRSDFAKLHVARLFKLLWIFKAINVCIYASIVTNFCVNLFNQIYCIVSYGKYIALIEEIYIHTGTDNLQLNSSNYGQI
jgi:hypothetical protein